jgi:hypothetical protein
MLKMFPTHDQPGVKPSTRESREAPPMASGPKVKVGEIEERDLESVVALLSHGFPKRTSEYWRRAVGRLRTRRLPGAYPRYGYKITDGDVLKGIVLLIFFRSDEGDIRANVSSWYVEPRYRLFSNMLLAPALRMPGVTFVNISPAPHTIPTIATQGFRPYSAGTFVSIAALGGLRPAAKLSAVGPDDSEGATILQRHAAMGCLAYEVTYNGKTYPFAFIPRRHPKIGIGLIQLVYCRDVADFVLLAGFLGRHLLRNGFPFVMLDANGPVKGLIGHYFGGRQIKCSRGEVTPRLGDLSDTELVLFGP